MIELIQFQDDLQLGEDGRILGPVKVNSCELEANSAYLCYSHSCYRLLHIATMVPAYTFYCSGLWLYRSPSPTAAHPVAGRH